MNSKTEFLVNIFLQHMIIRNVLYSKSAGRKNSQFKTWHFGNFSFQIFIVQENVCFRIWFLLFQKFQFKIWFSTKKFATKSCRLKSAGKFRNLLLSAEQIDSKRYFLNVMFWSKSDSSIKIELKTWFFDKKFFSKMWLSEMSCFRNLPELKNLNSKPDILEFFFSNFHWAWKLFLQNLITFFLKISFQTLIFNEKVCYKVKPFKISTQSEKLVVVHGANRVKTLFLRRDVFIEIWFLDINWTENLIFRKKIVSTNWYFEKFFIENRRNKKLSILKLINL